MTDTPKHQNRTTRVLRAASFAIPFVMAAIPLVMVAIAIVAVAAVATIAMLSAISAVLG